MGDTAPPQLSRATTVCALPDGQVAVQACPLEIVDGGGASIPPGKTWIVGERVVLKVQSKPAGQPLTSIAWWIPPETFASQTYTIPAGTVTLLSIADLQKDTVQFHFAAVPQMTMLAVTASVGGRVFTLWFPFQVVAPTGVTMTSKTGSVNIGPDSSPQKTLSLAFHEAATSTFGIEVIGVCTPPDDGELAFIQLIKSYRSHSRVSGQVKVIDSHDAYWLDDREHPVDQADVFTYNPTWPASPNTRNQVSQPDSPANPLAFDDNVSVAWDFFKIHLMYKPNKPDAAWVAIGKLEWKWGGTAERGPKGWSLTSSDKSTDPTGIASYELPVWSDAFQAHVKSDW